MTEFVGFPKIARYSRECIVTEKIDGTNGQIYIGPDGEFLVGSRTRWITAETDNHGFAAWAHAHKDELMQLGPGHHFGEWWGSGIQRGYGLPKGEKRWSMFNVVRWCMHGHTPGVISVDPKTKVAKMQDVLPACVGLVPVLWRGNFDFCPISDLLQRLIVGGSQAAPCFLPPEGIVIFHLAAGVGFKKTIEKDNEPKGARP